MGNSKMGASRNLLLLSNSTLHPTGYLEYAAEYICDFLKSRNVTEVLFVPYALRNQDNYAATARKAFESWGFKLTSIHETENPSAAAGAAQAIFIGGGNTFQLLNNLYEHKLIDVIRKQVLENGVPYMGSSAGTNVATISINTTNDMPIVYPPSFSAIGLVPFNINPHYLDTDPNSKHMGETREQRITQFHEEADTPCVLALREGSMLLVEGDKATLLGTCKAQLFTRGKPTVEYETGSDLSFLLTDSLSVGL